MKDSKRFRVQLCRRGRFSVKAPCLKTQSRTEGRHSQVTAAGAAAALMNLVHIISRNVTTSYAVLGSFLESTVSPTSCLAVSTTTSSPSSTKSLWSDNMWPTKARYFFFFFYGWNFQEQNSTEHVHVQAVSQLAFEFCHLIFIYYHLSSHATKEAFTWLALFSSVTLG